MSDASVEKEKIRKLVLEKLKRQPLEFQRKKSGEILEKLKRTIQFRASRAIMFYASTSFEVDTMPLLKEVLGEGRFVAVPFVDKANSSLRPVQIQNLDQDLIPGTYGILEPRPELAETSRLNRFDVVLVPGLAFDLKGYRLGRGKGYYDRFLKTLPVRVKRIGLAFDFQLFDSIPVEKWDVPVDEVITNKIMSS